MRPPRPNRSGLTLLEMILVVVILAALAALVIPMVGNIVGDSARDTTQTSMRKLQDVITSQYWSDMNGLLGGADGYPQPNPLNNPQGRVLHPQLRYLFVAPEGAPAFDPVSRRGWRGPYLQHAGGQYTVSGSFTATYGVTGDPTVLDGWGRPIIIQRVVVGSTDYSRLVSAGQDGTIQTSATDALPARSTCGDDLVLYLRTPDTRGP